MGPRVALRYKRSGLYSNLSWADYRARAVECAAALVDGSAAKLSAQELDQLQALIERARQEKKS